MLLLQLLMVPGMVLSFAWATVALDITVTTVLRKRHMHARHSSHSRSSQNCQSCHRRRLAHRHLHCHLARRRHSQQQISQRSRHQPVFGSSSRSSRKSWMVAAVLQLSPKRSLTLSLALSPRPEPHRHQRVCHQLEPRRSYIGGRNAAAASSAAAECHTHGLQHRTQLRRRTHRRSHRYTYRCRHRHRRRHRHTCSNQQRASFNSVQHSQNGQRVCLAHMNG